jgi:hypothetical protein
MMVQYRRESSEVTAEIARVALEHEADFLFSVRIGLDFLVYLFLDIL